MYFLVVLYGVSNISESSLSNRILPFVFPFVLNTLSLKQIWSDKNTIKIDQQDQIYEGVRSSGSSQNIILNTGSNYEFKLPGIHINALKTLNQEEITGSERMDKVLQNSTLSAGNQGNMWFGGKKLSPKDTNKLIYDPEAGLNAAYVPIKDDGSPDFDALEAITKVQDE